MGSQQSHSGQTMTTDITTSAFNTCPGSAISNEITLKNVDFRPDLNPMCNGSNTSFVIDQKASIESECLISHLQDVTSDVIAKMDAEAQAGLGFSYSDNKNDISTQIDSKIENDCGSQSSEQKASLEDVVITSCQLKIIQDATLKSSCTINTLQTIANKASVESNSTSSGSSIWGLLFGNGTSWLLLIVAIIVILIIVYMFMNGSSTPTTGTTTTASETTSSFNVPSTGESSSSYGSYGSTPSTMGTLPSTMGTLPSTMGTLPSTVGTTSTFGSMPSAFGTTSSTGTVPPIPGETPAGTTGFASTNPFNTAGQAQTEAQYNASGLNPFAGGSLGNIIGGAVGTVCSMGPVLGLGIILLIGLALHLRKSSRTDTAPVENFTEMVQKYDPVYTNDIPAPVGYGEEEVIYSQPGYNKFSQVYQEAYNNFERPPWAEKYIIAENGVISVYLSNSGMLIAQAPKRYRLEQNGIYFNLLSDGSEIISDMWGIIGTVPAPFVNNDKFHDYQYWQDFYNLS